MIEFNVGDPVKVRKPASGLKDYPTWVPSMNNYNGLETKIKVKNYEENLYIYLLEGDCPYWFRAEWLEEIFQVSCDENLESSWDLL